MVIKILIPAQSLIELPNHTPRTADKEIGVAVIMGIVWHAQTVFS